MQGLASPSYTYSKEYISPKDSSKTFLIRSLQESDIDSCVSLLVETHELCHPMMICLPYQRDIYSQILTRVINCLIGEDLSVVVVDQSTNSIVAVAFGKDLASPDADVSDLLAQWPEFQSYRKCIGIFNKRFPEYFSPKRLGESAKMLYITVRVEYQGLGLATQLVQVGCEHLKLSKYPYLVAQTVSKFTEKLFVKIGSKIIDSVEYETFETNEGERPFAKIKEELAKKGLSGEHLYYSLTVLDRSARTQ